MLACIVPSRSDGQQVTAYQTFHIRWRFCLLKSNKVVAYFYCHCKIYLIYVFCIFLLDYDMSCNNGTKIKQYQASPDLLLNIFYLFRMKIDCSYVVFKIPKRNFDRPYADILEMPISISENPCTRSTFRHREQISVFISGRIDV